MYLYCPRCSSFPKIDRCETVAVLLEQSNEESCVLQIRCALQSLQRHWHTKKLPYSSFDLQSRRKAMCQLDSLVLVVAALLNHDIEQSRPLSIIIWRCVCLVIVRDYNFARVPALFLSLAAERSGVPKFHKVGTTAVREKDSGKHLPLAQLRFQTLQLASDRLHRRYWSELL